MNEERVMMAVGGALTAIGSALVAAHVRSWRRGRGEWEDEFERRHLQRRFRRRVQTSALLAILGLLIGLHPLVIPDPKLAPRLFACWWIAALGVAVWVMLMALGDILATRAHSQVALDRIRLRQRALQHRLDEYQRHRTNGHHETNS